MMNFGWAAESVASAQEHLLFNHVGFFSRSRCLSAKQEHLYLEVDYCILGLSAVFFRLYSPFPHLIF